MSDDLVDSTTDSDALTASIATHARGSGWMVAVAESLTGGRICSHLGAAGGASAWFAGGVVAYSAEVKFGLLDVDRGPVVTPSCALQMAQGAARLLEADVAVAVTGVGGPEPRDGEPVGTVFTAVVSANGEHYKRSRFEGTPDEVVHAATINALRMLAAELDGAV